MLCRRVAAVVSLGVATAVVPQQGYTANICTPSVTQVSLPLQNVHVCVYIYNYTVTSHSSPFLLPLPKFSDKSPISFPCHLAEACVVGLCPSHSVSGGQDSGWHGERLPRGGAAVVDDARGR